MAKVIIKDGPPIDVVVVIKDGPPIDVVIKDGPPIDSEGEQIINVQISITTGDGNNINKKQPDKVKVDNVVIYETDPEKFELKWHGGEL